ncbi:ATP-binding protein [Mucilaginibacter sp. E4BP6]|uniref:ATP-binding protein n=1 Tax=Mucilaginibacter sp. E4BP6 TaxID=2723089 RepID=UPI0015C85D8F|nr:ATP-binding protein [Mucilaginibacter sp. E4BP6]NYE67848.1 PAS domain S-box-containing protein [Mucilaginibacter sp. E4BP6]
MNPIILDFEQAKSKHLLFKSRLRSILYDIPVEEGPVLSHHECSVGKWIYGHALAAYGHIPEMHELEMIHAEIHISARKLVALHKDGKSQEARNGLSEMEAVADQLVNLLGLVEKKLENDPGNHEPIAVLNFNPEEYNDLLRSNAELDKRIKQQIADNNESSLKYEAVLSALHEGIIIQDSAGVLISANQSAERLLGMTADQMRGLTSMSPDWGSIAENGEPLPGELHAPMLALKTGLSQINQILGITKKDQKVVWLSVNSQPLIHKETEEITGVVSSFFDVTATREYEALLKDSVSEQQALNEELAASNEEQAAVNEELISTNEELTVSQESIRHLLEKVEASESRFRFMLNAIPQQVWTATADGALDYVNQVVCDDFGYNTEEIVGHGWQAFIHPDDLENCLKKWLKALETGNEYVVEFRLKFKDGNYVWHLARAVPFAENKEILLWLGTNTNIDLQKMNEQRKDEFLSIASHELKTPLTSIKAYNQIVQKISDPEKLRPFLKKSADHIARLERLIGDLLDVTKINAGKIYYAQEPVNFRELMAHTVESVQHTTSSHEIILQTVPEITYSGDQLRLEQVLHNFLSNAVKYSPEAGKILVNGKVDEDNIIVSVQDFGIGIARENIDKLFNRYYRVDNTAMRFEGLGLGLFISAEILRKHGGSFWIESEIGKGSTFYFRLPLQNIQKPEVTKTTTFYRDRHIIINYNQTQRRLDVDWTGFHDEESVKHGCLILLEYLQNNKSDRIVNDNTHVLGNWSEAAEWVGNIWFPMMEKAGLKYFAHVFSPSTFSELAARKSIDIMAGIITTQFFSDVDAAELWINNQP